MDNVGYSPDVKGLHIGIDTGNTEGEDLNRRARVRGNVMLFGVSHCQVGVLL